jgi:hypothetical protein
LKIAVIDAQGGGLGKVIVERIKQKLPRAEVIALGTNVIATNAMLKAGADKAATGENAIVFSVRDVDAIIGGIGIVAANSMMGEISPKIAEAISSSYAVKVLIPIGKCHMFIPGSDSYTIHELIDMGISHITQCLSNSQKGSE